MPRPVRIAIIAAAVPLLLWAWIGVVFAMDRAADEGEILGRVSIGEVALAGLTRTEAIAAVESVEAALGAEPILVTIVGTEFTLLPSQVGFDLDEEALVDEAMRQGRGGGFFADMRWWAGNLVGGSGRVLQVQGTYNRDALLGLLTLWGSAAISDPPQEGGITIQGDAVVPVYPKAGTGLDIDATADLIESEVLGDRNPVVAITDFRTPVLTDDDIDRVVTRAEQLIGEPVTLAKILPQIALTYPPAVLRQSIASRIVLDDAGLPEVDLFFQIGPLVQYLNPIRDQIETAPIDAQVVIRPDDVPLVLPGSNGVKVDDGNLPSAVLNAATSVTRTGPLPVRDGAAPEFTTEDAEALGIRNLLYTATTFYTCCGDFKNQNRIINIHRIADEVNGAVILPGEVFSLNEYVGRRTEADGYRPAGAVIGPIVYCCDHPANIGGGVSQFTTTLYNAIWWAGLEDVAHTPHSLYFPRYPMVREATLGWPTPDLRFRNNSPNAVYLKTEYTDTSVTVKVFGDTGGITVEGITSERRALTEPAEYFDPDPTINPGEREQRDDGTPGFTADVTRIITYPDGTKKTEKWTWTYDPFPIRIAIHPCELPEDHPLYEPTPCPVQVPEVGGMTATAARSAIQSLGLVYAEGEPFIVTPGLEGTVRFVDPSPGTWLAIGETVTVRIGELAPTP
jgi:vancomycin resistance protein YoaR